MFRVNLSERFTPGVVFEELVKHPVRDHLGPGPVQFDHLYSILRVRSVSVQCAELTPCVTEQYEEVPSFTAVDFIQDAVLCVTVHSTREHAVLYRVQDDTAVTFGGGLLV
uniref:Uncharacterized protein n=1 Tax=Cacopsylla melanoneura TaxID=428564 RepID=A0A8D8TYF7_9HEMI